jgi:hypothetical protein
VGKVGEGATVADEAGLQEQLGDLEHWFNDDFRLVKGQKKKRGKAESVLFAGCGCG